MTNWQKTLDKNILNWRDVTAAELPEHLFKWLEKTCWEQRNKKLDILKMNDKLVGHIKEEYRIPEYPKEFEEFIDMFDKIPNPETYPKCFEFYMKLYKYYKWRKNERLQSQ